MSANIPEVAYQAKCSYKEHLLLRVYISGRYCTVLALKPFKIAFVEC